MLFHEVLGPKVCDYKIELFGSDLNRNSLAFAQEGEYESALIKGVPDALLKKYFDVVGGVAKVKDELRSHATFLHQDITEEGPDNLDMVFCRNVLIYMERDAHEKLMKSFHTRLSLGGFLVLGKTEGLVGNAHVYSTVNIPERVYRKIA
jgi:chemotaxis protein methyltransferase CheR